MKKQFIILVVMLLAGSSVFAQGISGGLRAGLNLADIDFSGGGFSPDTKSKAGLSAGAYLTVMFTEKLGLQPEAQFSMQGFTGDLGSGKETFKLNYVNVPIFIRYNVTSFLNIHAGPQFGLLLSAKEESTDIKDNLKSSDISGNFGVGVDLPFGLNGGVRYALGLSNIDDTGGVGTSKNRMFQVYLGYKLFGKK